MRKQMLGSLLTVTALCLACHAAAADAPEAAVPNKPVQDVHLTHVGLSDAIDYLRDASGANIEVDWKALETVGLSKDSPVSLRLRNVPLRVALKKTLDSASPGVADFIVDGNVITITSQEVADSRMVTRIIPVGDLLVDIPDFTDAPTMDLSQVGSNSGTSRGAGTGSSGSSTGGGGQSIFSGGSSTSSEQKTASRQDKAQQLIDTIESTVRPNIWDVNGGKAHIKYFHDSLIITAPAAVQQLIAG